MKRYLIATLGGNDLQYVEKIDKELKTCPTCGYIGKRDLKYSSFNEMCIDFYKKYCVEGVSHVIDNFKVPILKPLLYELQKGGKQIDTAIMVYTDQRDILGKSHEKDTYWMYQIVKHLAEKTDFFGYSFKVVGESVNGNPADLEEMFYLYKEVCTNDNLRDRYNIQAHDEIIACFTGGTPAITFQMMLAFSSLQYPAGGREYYYINNPRADKNAKIKKIALAELLRHDDVFILLKNLLESRQFTATKEVINSVNFTFLKDIDQDLVQLITALHNRSLFQYDASLRLWKNIKGSFTFYDRGQRQLVGLKLGEEFLRDFTQSPSSSGEVKQLIVEYYFKTIFFWRAEMWNEFVVYASSFYEWLLKIRFIDLIGHTYAKRNKKSERWNNFLRNSPPKHKPQALSLLSKQKEIYKKSERILFSKIITSISPTSQLSSGSWAESMGELYRIRNKGVHELKGTTGREVKKIINENWPEQTKDIIQQEFSINDKEFIDNFSELIDDVVNDLRNRFYVSINLHK